MFQPKKSKPDPTSVPFGKCSTIDPPHVNLPKCMFSILSLCSRFSQKPTEVLKINALAPSERAAAIEAQSEKESGLDDTVRAQAFNELHQLVN